MKKTLKDRESEFIRLCEPYFEKYGKQMIKEFVKQIPSIKKKYVRVIINKQL